MFFLKNQCSKTSGKIIRAYEKNILYLPLDKVGHFFERAYKLTGDSKYENILAQYVFINKIKKIEKAIATMETGLFEFANESAAKSERKKRRAALYKKNPKIRFYNALMIDLIFWKIFRLDRIFKDEFSRIISLLKKENFEKIYLNEKCIKDDSSFSFNSAFILRHLEIASFTDKMESALRKYYITKDLEIKKDLPQHEFFSLLYSMTHIIIADSKFYERYVAGHEWILDAFSRNINFILEKAKIDILSEIGLCFKLCKKEQKYKKTYDKIRSHLLKNFDPKKLDDPEFIIKKEHTNSILMMLFADNNKLFAGPDLSQSQVFKNLLENYA